MMRCLKDSQNSLMQMPIASGKTTAMIVGMFIFIAEKPKSLGLKALFVTSTEFNAINAYMSARNLSDVADFKIGLATRSHTLLPQSEYDVIFGTMAEIIGQIKESDMNTSSMGRIYVDNAESVLCYNNIWGFLDSFETPPILKAACLFLKYKSLDKMGTKLPNIQNIHVDRKHVFGNNTHALNIVCETERQKMDACKAIIARL